MGKKVLYIILLCVLLTIIIILIISFGHNVKYSYSTIQNENNFDLPINNPKEAVIYSNTIQEFINFKNNFKNTEDWTIEANYFTEKQNIQLFEKWYNSGKITKSEYDERIQWSKKQGDYWRVSWKSNGAFCDIEFTNSGQLKNLSTMGEAYNQSFFCSYLGK